MAHAFDFIATGIGSLPHADPDVAAALVLRYLPEAPIWPQLPARGFREHMDAQYSESLPGLVVDEAARRLWFETGRDLSAELAAFFERYLAKDYPYFALSEGYAAGFHAFVRALRGGLPTGTRFLKGHVTGPLTAGVSFKDEAGRDIVHHEDLFDALVKCLAMKAAWQVRELGKLGAPVIVFLDEPAMESLGSAFSSVSPETVREKIDEVADAVHEAGGLAGVHCCGNADWPLLLASRADIVNFDAFGYLDRVLLYPEEIRAFLARGGALAWGIVPTAAFTGSETVDGLVERLETGLQRLEASGISRETLLRQGIVTPSCGMGSLTVEKAEAILALTKGVSERMRARLAAR